VAGNLTLLELTDCEAVGGLELAQGETLSALTLSARGPRTLGAPLFPLPAAPIGAWRPNMEGPLARITERPNRRHRSRGPRFPWG